MKKNLIKTLSLLLVSSALFAMPVFAAENSTAGTASTNSTNVMVSYNISETKTYTNYNSIPSKIWYSGYYGGSYVSGYLYIDNIQQSDGYYIVTYSGDVTGEA